MNPPSAWRAENARRRHAYVLVALALSCVVLGSARSAHGIKLRVRAGSQIDARATGRAGRLEIRGMLRDDAGRPLEGRVRGRLRATPGSAALPVGVPSACPPTSVGQLHLGKDEILVDTDGAGSFCFTLPGAVEAGVVGLEFEGDRLYDRSTAEVPIDSSRHALTLSFSPDPRELPLEREVHGVWVDARLEPAADAPAEPVQLRLLLQEGTQPPREVARGSVRPGERTELELRSRELGGPGPATLVVEFAGSHAVQPARRTTAILRTARVSLSLAGSVQPADPSDGVDLDVAVGSALGAVPGGAIEALVAGQSAGTAPVSAGSAHLVAAFAAPITGVVPVTVRYLPDAPWWIAGDSVTVNVPVAPPSPWRRLPWVIAALIVGWWVVQGWRRPARTEKKEGDRTSLPPGRPSLDVIEVLPDNAGWRGRVLDAHEGTPIARAHVRIYVPSFQGDGMVAESETDEEGRFELGAVAPAHGARLVATATWHASLEKPLPPAGHLAVSLISRRRALLGRLVDWANRMGKPWARPGDPTPGHVATVARARHADDVGTWAEAVEQAAYGPEAPDAEAEGRIVAREPGFRPAGESER